MPLDDACVFVCDLNSSDDVKALAVARTQPYSVPGSSIKQTVVPCCEKTGCQLSSPRALPLTTSAVSSGTCWFHVIDSI